MSTRVSGESFHSINFQYTYMFLYRRSDLQWFDGHAIKIIISPESRQSQKWSKTNHLDHCTIRPSNTNEQYVHISGFVPIL